MQGWLVPNILYYLLISVDVSVLNLMVTLCLSLFVFSLWTLNQGHPSAAEPQWKK